MRLPPTQLSKSFVISALGIILLRLVPGPRLEGTAGPLQQGLVKFAYRRTHKASLQASSQFLRCLTTLPSLARNLQLPGCNNHP